MSSAVRIAGAARVNWIFADNGIRIAGGNMPLYQVAQGQLQIVSPTTFSDEKLLERKDLQQLLKVDVSPLGDDLLVIAEEFGQWEDSKRSSIPSFCDVSTKQ